MVNVSSTTIKKSLTLDAAKRIVAAAEQVARKIDRAMVIAVVDESGQLLHFSRMEGAAVLASDIAINKAYTSVGFGSATHQLYESIKDDPPLHHGSLNIDRLMLFGGGFPLTVDNDLVGAIGVSGGHYTEDMKVAEAGVAAI